MEKLLKLIVYLIIFVTPLLGFTSIGYEQTKVVFFIGALVLEILLWFVYWLIKRPVTKIQLSPINIVSSLFILVLLLTSYTGVNFVKSMVGGYPYLQGWFLYLALFSFSLLILQLKINLKIVSYLITFSALFVSLKAILDFILMTFFYQNIPNYSDRVVSTFGQPDFYAGFLLLTLPFQIAGQPKKWKIFRLICLVMTLIAIEVSTSRTAIFLALAYFIVLFVRCFRYRIRKIIFPLCAVTVILVGILSINLHFGPLWTELDYPPRIDYFFHDFPVRGFYFWQFRWSANPEKRIYIWPVVGDLIVRRPILGYGLENLETVFPTADLAQFHGIKNLTVDRSHNYTLDLLFFSGFLGFLVWLLLVILMFRRVRSGSILSALVLYLIWIQFQNQSVVELIFFWMLEGLINIDNIGN